MVTSKVQIRWHLEKHPYNSTRIIVIENCPKCGKPGYLTKAGKGAFRIRHKNDRRSNTGCRIGKNNEYNEQLAEIWKRVRGRRGASDANRI